MVEPIKNPFYLQPIPQELLELLFVNREKEMEQAKRILQSDDSYAVVSVLGSSGTGKSTMLNAISSLSNEKSDKAEPSPDLGFDVLKVNVPKPGVYLIDNVNTLDDKFVLSIYQKLSELGDKKIFFADELRRSPECVHSRRNITTHASIILSDNLTTKEVENFLKVRMKRCGKDYTFTTKAIEIMSHRARGNLRDFFKYCNEAYTIAKGRKVTPTYANSAIVHVDAELIETFDSAEKEILRILMEKDNMNIGEIIHDLKKRGIETTRPTLQTKFDSLGKYGIVSSRKQGNEVIYQCIYRKLAIDIKEIL